MAPAMAGVLLLALLLPVASLRPPPSSAGQTVLVAQWVARLAARCFPTGGHIAVPRLHCLQPPQDWQEELLLAVLRSHRFSVLTMRLLDDKQPPCNDPGPLRKPAVGYLLAGSAQQVRRAVLQLETLPGWNPKVRFLAVILATFPGPHVDQEDVSAVLKAFWSVSALNVVLASLSTEPGRESARLYTMFPFANATQLCGRLDIGLRRLGNALQLKGPGSDLQLSEEDLFPEKVPRDLGGCVVRGSMSPEPLERIGCHEEIGSEPEVRLMISVSWQILLETARIRNFTVEAKTTPVVPSDMSEDGIATGRFQVLARDDVDVAASAFFVTASRNRWFTPSTFIAIDDSVIHVKCHHTWRSHSVLVSFVKANAPLLLLLALIVPLTASFLWFLVSHSPGPRPDRSGCSVAMVTLAVVLEQAVHWPRAFRSMAFRVPLASLFLFGFTFNMSLKAQMTSETTFSPSEGPIASVEQFVASDRTLHYTIAMEEEVIEALGITRERRSRCSHGTRPSCGERFATDYNFALLTTEIIPHVMWCPRACHYKLPGVVKRSNYVLYSRKSFPLAYLMDRTISHLHASGILLHWVSQNREKRSAMRFRRKQLLRQHAEHYKEVHRQLNRIWAAWTCLGAGLASATLVFAVELAFGRRAGWIQSRPRRTTRVFSTPVAIGRAPVVGHSS